MTNLTESLLLLRSAYGCAHQALLCDEKTGEAHTLELCEAFVEQLPPECLRLSATQAVLDHLVRKLPESEKLDKWKNRLAVHLYHMNVNVNEPLYSLLFGLATVARES